MKKVLCVCIISLGVLILGCSTKKKVYVREYRLCYNRIEMPQLLHGVLFVDILIDRKEDAANGKDWYLKDILPLELTSNHITVYTNDSLLTMGIDYYCPKRYEGDRYQYIFLWETLIRK